MKNITIVIFLILAFQTTSNGQRFNLWNITDSHADASILFIVSCPEPIPLRGYLTSKSNDTFYIKALYPVYGCFAQFQSTNRDTMYNVAFPSGTNYINISKNNLIYREQTQSYNTTWNVKDSTFNLRPTAISNTNISSQSINIYPNPADNMLFIEKGLEYK